MQLDRNRQGALERPRKISIVVPAYNEEKVIAGSLQAIQNASRAFLEVEWQSELIVCDNNSTDQTAALAKQAGAAVVFVPPQKKFRGRN
jgi:glycosyltransferase involved in cell wall biosynthesis